MKNLLKNIHTYIRRKLKELSPEFISIVVWVSPDVHRDLADEFGAEAIGDRSSVTFKEGEWPEETVLNLTPVPPEEE